MEQVREVEVAFLATAALLAGLLYVAYRRPVRITEARIRPGSAEEAGGGAGGGWTRGPSSWDDGVCGSPPTTSS